MKKRAHIPHNCEMLFEIRQEKFNECRSDVQALAKTDQVVSRNRSIVREGQIWSCGGDPILTEVKSGLFFELYCSIIRSSYCLQKCRIGIHQLTCEWILWA
jgi:hypothetical protein